MAPQGGLEGQATHTALRRTVDRVDERFDERSRLTPIARIAPGRRERRGRAPGSMD
jgi:hypothetical protein